MEERTRILLDKNVARRMLEGLASLAENTAPNDEEQIALDLLFSFTQRDVRIFIVPSTARFLKARHDDVEEVREFRERVEVIVSAPYWRRWARRLQAFGSTREDARVLSLGTFGTDEDESFLGADEILTFDKPMANLFRVRQKQIQAKLDAMKRDLEPPYDDAELPDVKLLGME